MSRREARVAAGCGALALTTFVAIPALDQTDTSVVEAGAVGWWVIVATLVVQAALLLRASVRPRAVLVATAALALVAAAAGAGDAASIASLAVVVATYVAATSLPQRELWPSVAAAAALVATADAVGAAAGDLPLAAAISGAIAQAVATLGLTLLVAALVATRRETIRARESQASALVREQEALVQAAIARERTAMARELHDIAAHHLSGIAVMTGAIGAQIDTDPQGAKQAVLQVRAQSTAVLRDLRSLVGLLRDQDAHGDVRPETLAGLAGLVADATRTGREVDLTVLTERDEPGRGVGPLAQLAAYRAVQEALANAARHAPGARCHVTLDDRAAEAVVVEVRNGASTAPVTDRSGGGFGLIGMRERAELTGATLEVGPTDDGGWRVLLRLPREEEMT